MFRIVLIINILIIGCCSTPLDDYVHMDDQHFNWSLIKTYEEVDYKLYILNFTSQKWLDGLYSY